jgi:alpha-ribazole phosphatase
MGKLILVRHGESALNTENLFFGQLDPELTEKGRNQANKTKDFLKKIEYSDIYTSPLKRAYETANIINTKGYKLHKEDRLKELNFGILEGMTYDEILEKYPEDAKKWHNNWKTYNYRTGESVEDLQNRAVKFIESLDFSSKNIVVVCHFGVINCILSHYFSNGLDGYWKFSPNYAGVIIIEFTDGYPILKGLNIGDTYGNI